MSRPLLRGARRPAAVFLLTGLATGACYLSPEVDPPSVSSDGTTSGPPGPTDGGLDFDGPIESPGAGGSPASGGAPGGGAGGSSGASFGGEAGSADGNGGPGVGAAPGSGGHHRPN